jgi:hypothetical protein
MMFPPMLSKSRTFRVTKVRSYASAVAAIGESTVGRGRPPQCSLGNKRCPAIGHLAIHWKYASTALALGTQLDFLLNFRQSDDAHRPIVLGQNIRIDQEPTHVRSTGRG